MSPSIGIAVITHKAKHHLPKCLPPWLKSPLKPRILVVNSSSQDGTVELARELGAETLVIPRSEFNHGKTRELARKHLNTDIIVMTTPDAYPVDENVLEKLIQPLRQGSASVSYARQIPHHGAGFFEAFPRAFNYPAESHIRHWSDRHKYGVYTIFCSDSCSAYLNNALNEIGGFPEVLIGEDTIVVAKLLQRDHAIAYTAEAIVHHSHEYGLKAEFRRHFDTGLARKEFEPWIQMTGKDSERGREFAKAMLKQLLKEKPLDLPYAFIHLAVKWAGYKIGKMSLRAPNWWKKALSSQDFYWK